MKKVFFYALAAFAMMAVGCNKDDKQNSGDDNGISVVGTWNLHHEDDFETLVLNEDMSYGLVETSFYKEEGTYTYGSNTLVLTPSKAWERDWVRDDIYGGPVRDENGNYQYTEWQEIQPRESSKSIEVRLLYEGDVMLMKKIDDHSGEAEVVWAPYVKEDATHVSNIGDIQGKWYWLMGEGGTPRVIVNVNGNNGDVIITPWGERYTGTIRYEKGVIYMDNPTFTTTRYEDGEDGWEHMNEEDPENSDWRVPFGEHPYEGTYEHGLALGFVADGNVAYGGVANLLARFVKQ